MVIAVRVVLTNIRRLKPEGDRMSLFVDNQRQVECHCVARINRGEESEAMFLTNARCRDEHQPPIGSVAERTPNGSSRGVWVVSDLHCQRLNGRASHFLCLQEPLFDT